MISHLKPLAREGSVPGKKSLKPEQNTDLLKEN